MNELITGHPNLTNGVGQGQITSKPDGKPSTSENNNEEILERTAHSAVLSVSKGKLHAQERTGVSSETIVDDVSFAKKSDTTQDKTVAEALATSKDEKSKQDQGSNSDSESFSEAQATETLKAKSGKEDENLKQLIVALQSLKKSDCRRILENPNFDSVHALGNLWDAESTKRLTEAANAFDGFETRLKSKIEALDSFSKFESYVIAQHQNSDDQALSTILLTVSKTFGQGQPKRISGFDQSAKNTGLKRLFEFLQNEDPKLIVAQKRLIRDVNLAYLKTLIAKDQGSEKLHYRLQVAFKFSRIKKSNPLEKLRQSVIENFAGDESVKSKAKSFKDTTKKNWSTLFEKLVHSVSEFSQILFSGLFSLLSEVNEKFGKDLAAKPAPVFVRTSQKNN
jgi:hypothetical protein